MLEYHVFDFGEINSPAGPEDSETWVRGKSLLDLVVSSSAQDPCCCCCG